MFTYYRHLIIVFIVLGRKKPSLGKYQQKVQINRLPKKAQNIQVYMTSVHEMNVRYGIP